MILGLITPTSGSITINNKILTNNHHYLAKMNFASPYVELPKKLKVIENLKVYAMMYEISNAKAKIEQLVEELNLAPILYKKLVNFLLVKEIESHLPNLLLMTQKYFSWMSLLPV